MNWQNLKLRRSISLTSNKRYDLTYPETQIPNTSEKSHFHSDSTWISHVRGRSPRRSIIQVNLTRKYHFGQNVLSPSSYISTSKAHRSKALAYFRQEIMRSPRVPVASPTPDRIPLEDRPVLAQLRQGCSAAPLQFACPLDVWVSYQ